jgi:hypothetical protein
MRLCEIGGCDRKHYGKGMCHPHWQRDRRGQQMVTPIVDRPGWTWHVNNAGYLATRANNRYILQHRMIMEEKLGRSLLPGENVHHINGVRTDNRPENLELWVSSQPPGQRPHELVEWARHIIRLYGD